MVHGKGILDDFSFVIPPLLAAFRFEKDTSVMINKAISQIPKELCDSKRNQYQSDHLLMWLQQTFEPSASTKLLAVCDFDAYFGKYNFCFGEAIISGKISAIYLARLLPLHSNVDKKFLNLFQDRIVKEAIHEIGHNFGLRHCSRDHCIMFKSRTISDTDKKNSEFCMSCIDPLAVSLKSPSN